MKLLLLNQTRGSLRAAWCERWVKALTRNLLRRGFKKVARKELVLVFVSAAEIQRLNQLYRRKNYSTDILSFQPAEPGCLGELVLCPSFIRQQAKRTGLGEYGELGYMIVHGVLHLLGFDHEEPKGQAEMFELQDEVYAQVRASVGLR